MGATASYTPYSLALLSNNTSIDFNSLRPNTQTGSMELQYKPVGLGANIGFLMANKDSRFGIREITFSYQRIINQAQWSSEYATTQNAPTERGQNIFSLTTRFHLLRGQFN